MKRKLAIFTTFLIIILAGISFWLLQRNVFSKEVLKLEILGPEEIEFGQEVEYIVKYKNNGSALLEEPRLIFEYPEYSDVIAGTDQGVSPRQEMELKNLYPGEERTISFRARLLGKEREAKVARVWLNYQPKNLRARYESFTTFTTVIKNIPISFEYDMPSKIDPGKINSFRLNYFSNLTNPISDLVIKAEYPDGFEFRESQPRSIGNNEWEVPILNKAEGGRIIVSGILDGAVGETKIFRASLGMWQNDDFVLLKEIARGVEIAQPSIFISQSINGSSQYIANPGDYLHYEVFFRNTGEQVFDNLFMAVQLQRELLDLSTLRADFGQAQQEAGSIIWDHTTIPELKFLAGGEEGKVEFWVKLKDELPQRSEIRTRISVGLAREEFTNKINTRLTLNQRGFFHQGQFQNLGPLPPQVGQTTTYTIVWQIENFNNEVKNAKIRAFLPSYVILTGEISSKDARFTFDQISRELVWEIGDLSPKTKSSELSFQVAFVPLPDQRGQSPELLSQIRVIAEDDWTKQTINFAAPTINITMPHDPSISKEQGIVQ